MTAIATRLASNDGVVALRRWSPDDIPALIKAYADPWVPPTWEARTIPLGVADARAFVARCAAEWRDGSKYSFAITRGSDGTLMGGCSVARLDEPGLGQLGYWLMGDFRGHGYMTRSVDTLTSFAFGPLGLRRLRLLMRSANTGSAGVARRAGFTPAGISNELVRGVRRRAQVYILEAPRPG